MFGSSWFSKDELSLLSVVSSRLSRFGVVSTRFLVALPRWRRALCLVLLAWSCPAMAFTHQSRKELTFELKKPFSGDLKTKIFTETQCLVSFRGRCGQQPELKATGPTEESIATAMELAIGFMSGAQTLDIDSNTQEEIDAKEKASSTNGKMQEP